jgi:hypothetical protein
MPYYHILLGFFNVILEITPLVTKRNHHFRESVLIGHKEKVLIFSPYKKG